MSDVLVVEPVGGLSQVERVVDTFVAPSKTFTDILRSTSWWLPFLLAVIVSMGSAFAMDKKIGFDQIAESQIAASPASEEQMSQLPPDQRAARMHMISASTKYSMYASAVIILIFTAILSLLNWASLNFGLGATTTFGQNFAVCMYAGLPRMLTAILNVVLIYAGVNTENYNLNNPVGTNLGYYMTDSPNWLKTMLSFFDIFGVWTLVLMVIGTSIIAKKTKGQAAIVVVGWWLLGMIIMTGIAAAKG